MDSMEHLIGQRFSLISKSQIRYEGILHEINPEQSAIALEEVYSFGTEGREVANFIPATQQKYDYIVFRGSDVKDISIAEPDKAEEPQPSSVPNDPAILNSSRPPNAPSGPSPSAVPNVQNRGQSPLPPPGYAPQSQQFGPGPGYYPAPQPFGRGFGPPPPGPYGPSFNPYGPPPGYYGPPGQRYPPGPVHFQPPPPPIGPPGPRSGPNQPPSQSAPEQPPAPSQAPQSTSELPVDLKGAPEPTKSSTAAPSVAPAAPAPTASAPAKADAGPSETKPTDPQPPAVASTAAASAAKGPPAQPKGGKIAPAIPFTVNQKSFIPPVQPSSESTNAAQPVAKAQQSRAEIDAAQAKARQAVAEALAKVNQPTVPAAAPVPTAVSVDTLAQKITKLGPSPAANGTPRGRGGPRGGRGFHPRGQGGGQYGRKIEIPKSDYDFESANAKFNKDDFIKEATSSGLPTVEGSEEPRAAEEPTPAARNDISPVGPVKAYNKATSFFDNISSEAKQRGEGDVRAHARQQRGEEFKKNVETFGQGNVDGGYRGRGRGGYGRGRQYGGTNRGYHRGYNAGGYQGRGRGAGYQAANSSGAPPPAPTSS
ncbi:hypothetical protein DV736_g5381, partial [Chaetothyriales sp. CBS 134916]